MNIWQLFFVTILWPWFPLTNQLLHHAPLILNGLIKPLKPMALYIQFSNRCYLPSLFVFVDNTCITGVMKGWQFSYILPRTGNPDRQGPRAPYTDSRAHADCHLTIILIFSHPNVVDRFVKERTQFIEMVLFFSYFILMSSVKFHLFSEIWSVVYS